MARPFFERFIHVPGPNPIVSPGGPGEWDEKDIEACCVFKDGHTYYFYYHGPAADKERWGDSYRIGLATATHPLGPWKRYGKAPVIDVGPKGSWDSFHVACAAVLKERENTYYMWYSGTTDGGCYGVGLATAGSPVGPWTKYEKNPIMDDFGYIGGVVKAGGKYYMYSEHPISSTSPDEGPFCLATADKPEGPWEQYEGNPVLPAGDWGTWDDGGYSEAGMLYHEGMFHTFYGGTKWVKQESIGYAYSFDGKTFHRHPANPIVMRERCPDIHALAEIHPLFEPPLFYLYYSHKREREREHLGVQVAAISTPFRFDMPVMTMDGLGAGKATELEACPLIGTENVNRFALTAECSYDEAAKAGLRTKVFPSYDGLHYDTDPMVSFDNAFQAGQRCQRTIAVDPMVKFAKVVLENLDGAKAVSDVKVVATLGCI